MPEEWAVLKKQSLSLEPRIRLALLLILAFLGGPVLSPFLGAQTRPEALCIRPAPQTRCRSFVLFEARGQSPFVQPYREVRFLEDDQVLTTVLEKELSHSFGWDAGLALNVSPRWAAGVVLGYEFAEASRRRAAAIRIRRWITDDIAVELAPGIFSLRETGAEADEPRTGGSLALRLLLWDLGIVAFRYDALDVESSETVVGGVRRVDPGGLEQSWSVGLGLENLTGLGASILGFLGLAVVLSL